MVAMLTALALLQAADGSGALVERTRALTSVSAHCAAGRKDEEVLVCARRRADAYRLPLVDRVVGSRADPTPDQRVAGIAPRSNCDNLTPFLVGCGSVGAGVRLSSDGSSRAFTARERTPDIAR